MIRFAWMSLLCLLPAVSFAAQYYDFGTAESACYEAFQPVTHEVEFEAGRSQFGWEHSRGMTTRVKVHAGRVENQGRGTTEPPPIFTNPLTEDVIIGEEANAFLAQVPAGRYHVCVFSGASERHYAQVFDFTATVGEAEQRVVIDGGYRFEELRFSTTVGDEPLAISFTPRSKWLVNGILIWAEGEDAQVREAILDPLEQMIYRLPPEEWEQWKEERRTDNSPWPEIEAYASLPYLIHHRPYLEPVYPHTVPLEHTLNPTLRAFATRGEYEPLTFTVWPGRQLKGAKVRVSDLTREGAAIPANAIDIRHVVYTLCRTNYTATGVYRNNPDWLEHFDALDLAPDMNHRFWLTVHVPDSAPGGVYRGEATFEAQGVPAARVPIEFRVLPITLQEDPDKIYGIYYRHPLDKAASAKDDVSREYYERQAELEAQDLVAHGTRNVVLSLWCRPADEEGNFSLDAERMQSKLDLAGKHGFKPPYVVSINTGGVYRKHVQESYGSHLRGVKQPPPEFAAELTAMVKYLEGVRKERGWPDMLYYPIDEPSTNSDSVNFMVTVLKAVRDAGVRTYVTADPMHEQFEPMRPFIDVWCCQPFNPDRETILADSQARGVEYWCYPNHVNGENDHTPVAGARMTYGFGFWRSGFRTLIPWIYSASNGDPFNYLDARSMDFFNRHEPDGTPMPVAMWEAYREGYDDYRYVYTLQQAIAAARKSGDAERSRLADAAQEDLDYVWNAIEAMTKYKYDVPWGHDEFDVYRWMLARHLLTLAAEGV